MAEFVKCVSSHNASIRFPGLSLDGKDQPGRNLGLPRLSLACIRERTVRRPLVFFKSTLVLSPLTPNGVSQNI